MDYQSLSVPALVRSVLDDARELIREEVAVAKSEIREEMSAAQTVGISFAAAAVTGIVAVVLLSVAVGGGVAHLFELPPWAGHGIVALLMAAGSFIAIRYGQRKLANLRALPKTTATLRENIAWIQDKSRPNPSRSE